MTKPVEIPEQLRGLPSCVYWERQGSAWRIYCTSCVQEVVVPDLDHCRVSKFTKSHTHKEAP